MFSLAQYFLPTTHTPLTTKWLSVNKFSYVCINICWYCLPNKNKNKIRKKPLPRCLYLLLSYNDTKKSRSLTPNNLFCKPQFYALFLSVLYFKLFPLLPRALINSYSFTICMYVDMCLRNLLNDCWFHGMYARII